MGRTIKCYIDFDFTIPAGKAIVINQEGNTVDVYESNDCEGLMSKCLAWLEVTDAVEVTVRKKFVDDTYCRTSRYVNEGIKEPETGKLNLLFNTPKTKKQNG